mgnify:CR=1 FL=1
MTQASTPRSRSAAQEARTKDQLEALAQAFPDWEWYEAELRIFADGEGGQGDWRIRHKGSNFPGWLIEYSAPDQELGLEANTSVDDPEDTIRVCRSLLAAARAFSRELRSELPPMTLSYARRVVDALSSLYFEHMGLSRGEPTASDVLLEETLPRLLEACDLVQSSPGEKTEDGERLPVVPAHRLVAAQYVAAHWEGGPLTEANIVTRVDTRVVAVADVPKSSGEMPRFWASFWVALDSWEIPARPRGVLGYWKTGIRDTLAGPEASVVALIEARDEWTARRLARTWGKIEEWRFCQEKPPGWTPGDRFAMPTVQRFVAGDRVHVYRYIDGERAGSPIEAAVVAVRHEYGTAGNRTVVEVSDTAAQGKEKTVHRFNAETGISESGNRILVEAS